MISFKLPDPDIQKFAADPTYLESLKRRYKTMQQSLREDIELTDAQGNVLIVLKR